MGKKIIAVDFDGTLFTDKSPNVGEPIWETINYCKKRKENGEILILWTCRNGKDLDIALKACSEVGLVFDYINENTIEHALKHKGNEGRKIYAHEYIDDKAKHIKDLEVN